MINEIISVLTKELKTAQKWLSNSKAMENAVDEERYQKQVNELEACILFLTDMKINSEHKPQLHKGNAICRCPVCKSSSVTDAGLYENNGVFGHGNARWKSFEAMLCSNCGVMFRKVNGNGI